MKLSAQHDSGGLTGHIRSVQTGEVVHFQFVRGTVRIPFEVVLGDKRLEVMLRVERVTTDPGDDLDVEMTLRAPDLASSASLDYVPKISPPSAGGKIDQDGSAMDVPVVEDVVIQEGPPVEKQEMVLTEQERDRFAVQPSELPIDASANGALFEGEDQVGEVSAPVEESHPATRIPELPGVGGDRKGKRGRR